MATLEERRLRQVPARALILSLLALAVPVAGSFVASEAFQDYAALLWLLALIPAFLLAYFRGWRGIATALAVGMATLSLTQVVATWAGRPIPDILLGIVVAYVAISMGIGWMAEVFHKDVEEVEDLAFTDLLTHLPNRRHARIFLENEFAAAERGRQLATVLFDLDGFKDYNDRYGHQAGDEALKAFGEVLLARTRKMNLSSRFGGEEFLSILAGTDEEGAMAFADRIRGLLKEYSLPQGGLTVSAGVAAYHPSMRSPDELIAAADHALYQAKHEGRDGVRLFGHHLLETIQPSTISPEDDRAHPEGPKAYPRSSDDIGHTPPPETLLPHQITGFGKGRRVLLLEDDDAVRKVIGSYLDREGFEVREANTAPSAIRELRTEFDLVVTDLHLPGPDGVNLIRAVKSRWPETPVIVITGMKDSTVAAEALAAGADRYLYKPFGMPELRTQLIEVLNLRDANIERRAGAGIASGDGASPESVESVRLGALSLAHAGEQRDAYMRGHAERVWEYSRILADAVDPDATELERVSLELGCRLHDMGRLTLAHDMLEKDGPLSEEESARLREHPRIGREILEPVLRDSLVLAVVAWHHECWDGTGYPDGLGGEAIPLSARLVGLADALDAMTHPRPHRKARTWNEAVEEIRAKSGTQFDPGLLDAFEASLDRLREAHYRLTVEDEAPAS